MFVEQFHELMQGQHGKDEAGFTFSYCFLTSPTCSAISYLRRGTFLLPFSLPQQNGLCIMHHYVLNQSSLKKKIPHVNFLFGKEPDK